MNKLVKILRPALTVIEYAIAVLIVTVSTQIFLGNTLETYVITIISVCLSVFTYIIWYSDGVDRGENVPKMYNTSLLYHAYAKLILDKGDFDSIRDFCAKKNEEYEREILTAKLGEYELSLKNLEDYKEKAQIARETAERKPKAKIGNILIGSRLRYTDEYFIKLRHRYTKEQLKVLDKYSQHKIRFKHLQVKDITRANSKSKTLVPENTEKRVLPSKLAGKIIWGLLLGIFTAVVIFTSKEWTMSTTIRLILWAFSISYNIYSSIRTGYKSVVVDRYNYFKAKNELCLEYFAFTHEDVKPIEQALESQMKE